MKVPKEVFNKLGKYGYEIYSLGENELEENMNHKELISEALKKAHDVLKEICEEYKAKGLDIGLEAHNTPEEDPTNTNMMRQVFRIASTNIGITAKRKYDEEGNEL